MSARATIHRVTTKELIRALQQVTPTMQVCTYLTKRQAGELFQVCNTYGVTPSTIVGDMLLHYTNN